MRGLRLFFWGGALALSAYGLARICLLQPQQPGSTAGAKQDLGAVGTADIPGPAFADKIEAVRRLKRENRHQEAVALLLRLLTTAEKEAARTGSGIAAWYYEQLAILYRRQQRLAAEVEILERYLAAQAKLGGTPARQMVNRLARAKELAAHR